MSSTPVVIVTGATRGIGLAVVKYLLNQPDPVRVIATGRSQSALDSLSNQFPDTAKFSTFCADMGGKEYTTVGKNLLKDTIDRWGRVDGLLLNHAVLDPVEKIENATVTGAEYGDNSWEELFRVNLFSYVSLVKEFLGELRNRNGRVIFVSSGAAMHQYQGWSAYGASKAALNHFSMTLAKEEPEITSLAIRPGVVDTGMQKALREDHKEAMDPEQHSEFIKVHEMGKLVDPDELAVVLGNLTMRASNDLSGKFTNWNDESLKSYNKK